jgi:hypothetical protein
MKPAPTHAYKLFDRRDEDGPMRVVFAATVAAARRAGLEDVEYIDVGARRAPEFDRFAPGPVPLSALLEEGWYQECWGCPRHVHAYDLAIHDDGSGNARGEFDDARHAAWCSPECRARDDGRTAEREAAEAEARRRWPDARSIYVVWNRSAYDEPPPSEWRLCVRLYWKRADADVYATWWVGDRDHEPLEIHPHARTA